MIPKTLGFLSPSLLWKRMSRIIDVSVFVSESAHTRTRRVRSSVGGVGVH